MKKYYLKTLGCQSNMADSDRIRWVMESSGYQQTSRESDANVIIYNTCSVRESAENRIFGRNKIIKNLKAENPLLKIVLTGCMMHYGEKELKSRMPDVDVFISIKNIVELPKKIGGRLDISPDEYLSIPAKRDDNIRAWIPISYGCNNFCSYCIVPFARGREYSRPAKEILNEVNSAVKNGAKEIWLLGQNVNSYGMMEKTSWEGKTKKGSLPKIKKGCMTFSDLMREVNKIPGDFWIRFTSAHPKDFSDDLIKAMSECDKFPKYINLPVQSGDNEVLKRMNRQYTREHFIKLINKIRKQIPNIAISTDTIVGFCGESAKEFKNTIDLYKKLGFDMAFIAEYSSRSGTAASISFKDGVSHNIKDSRRKQLTEVLKKSALKNSKPLLNQNIRILVDEKKNGRWFGKSPQNKTVEILSTSGVDRNGTLEKKINRGDFIEVQITEIGSWILKGVPL